VIAGNGEVSKLIINELNNRIFVINRYINTEELNALIQNSRFVIAPYTDATHSAVVMTAFAFQKPIIASNVGGIPEVIEHNLTGKLVPPRDAEALARAILELLRDSEMSAQIAVNILERTAKGKLSWDSIARKTIDAYNESINDSGHVCVEY
jgi:glycosyltransferase involved in cell wall biosynthesis